MLVVTLVSLLMVGMASTTTVVVTFQVADKLAVPLVFWRMKKNQKKSSIFQEENYLVQGGCPSNEPEVQK